MLTALSRVGWRIAPSKIRKAKIASPSRRVASVWKKPTPLIRASFRSYCFGEKNPFNQTAVREEELPHEMLSAEEIAKTLELEAPSLDDMIRFGKEYTRVTGKPLAPPVSNSSDPKTVKLNSLLKSHFEAFEYDAMRVRWMIAMRDYVVPDCNSLAWMIEGLVEAKRPEMFEPVAEVMNAIGMAKTLPLLKAILHFSAYTVDGRRASETFKELLTSGLKPDIRCVDYYMQSHAKLETLPIAIDTFTKYPEKWNLTVDVEMQSSFIEILLKLGKEEMALKRYEAMEGGKQGMPFPNNRTINVMMSHYLSKGDNTKVQELFDGIHERFGLYPDKDNYATLLSMKMAQGLHDEAFRIVLRLCGERWPVSSELLAKLMVHYVHSEDYKSVEKIWALLPRAKVRPTLDHLTAVFLACISQNKPDRALAYLTIAHDKYGVRPSRTLYAGLISQFGAKHDLAKSLTIYRRMVFIDKVLPGPTTFFALAFAYVSNGELDSAMRLLQNPDNHGIPRINRHHFETAIESLQQRSQDPLRSLMQFDWTRLEGVTSETIDDLKTLNESLKQA